MIELRCPKHPDHSFLYIRHSNRGELEVHCRILEEDSKFYYVVMKLDDEVLWNPDNTARIESEVIKNLQDLVDERWSCYYIMQCHDLLAKKYYQKIKSLIV